MTVIQTKESIRVGGERERIHASIIRYAKTAFNAAVAAL